MIKNIREVVSKYLSRDNIILKSNSIVIIDTLWSFLLTLFLYNDYFLDSANRSSMEKEDINYSRTV